MFLFPGSSSSRSSPFRRREMAGGRTVLQFVAFYRGVAATRQGAIVERKTVRGLHRSVAEGRVWMQLGRLRTSATWPYLLIEGADLGDGPLGYESARGIWLAVSDLGIILLRSDGAPDSAMWLLLLDHFGSLERVLSAEPSEWQSIPGVGP